MIEPSAFPTIWLTLENWQHELLLFSAVWFLVGAIDDLIIDALWLLHRSGRWLARYRIAPPMRACEMPAPQMAGLIAIFIPTWREADVITAMLARCRTAWGNSSADYRIYIGCYPNDREGVAAIMAGCRNYANARLVLCDRAGPTSKADCLNSLWRALTRDELAAGVKAKAIVLHDAEDMVHADELGVYDYLIERATAVQLPVIPVRVPGSRWISGHYCDEFAEAHGKALVVREAIGAAIPLAGVGCAISRSHLGRIALENDGLPFDRSSLTEDYELGLSVAGDGNRTIFARIQDATGQLVGTRACFPDTLSTAVRQKARWMTGIALAGWDRLGWQGGFIEFWMRLRDRKAVFAAIVLTAAYGCILLTAILTLGHLAGHHQPKPFGNFLLTLMAINAVLLLWRLWVRACFVARVHGKGEAMISVPRTLIANIIAIMAARRAVAAYVRYIFGAVLRWDKTAHSHFPSSKTSTG